jgi:hypothetical protein
MVGIVRICLFEDLKTLLSGSVACFFLVVSVPLSKSERMQQTVEVEVYFGRAVRECSRPLEEIDQAACRFIIHAPPALFSQMRERQELIGACVFLLLLCPFQMCDRLVPFSGIEKGDPHIQHIIRLHLT